jgi:hypothetical protein
MEASFVTLAVVDDQQRQPHSVCIVCGKIGVDRRIGHTWVGIHRHCEVKLKKLESEELHQLYEQLAAVQERCTQQEVELRGLRELQLQRHLEYCTCDCHQATETE